MFYQVSIQEIIEKNKKYIPHFFVLYTIYIIILFFIFAITKTPFMINTIERDLGEQPIALLFVALIVPLVLSFFLMNTYSLLQMRSARLAKYTPLLLILYVGYLVVLFFTYFWSNAYLSPELISYYLLYGILAVIPILLFLSLYFWQRLFHVFRSLERKIILGTFLFLMYQLFLNFVLFSVLSLQIPEGIDMSVFYGMLDPDVFSGSEKAQFNLLVSIFVIFNIVCNVLVGWLSWKWKQKGDSTQVVQCWIISFVCFGIVDLVLNLVLLYFEPEVIQGALFPWIGVVNFLGLDYYLFSVVTMGDILNLISSMPILSFFYIPIIGVYFIIILIILLFSIVLLPLIIIGNYYLGWRLRNFWEKRKLIPETGIEEKSLNSTKTEN